MSSTQQPELAARQSVTKTLNLVGALLAVLGFAVIVLAFSVNSLSGRVSGGFEAVRTIESRASTASPVEVVVRITSASGTEELVPLGRAFTDVINVINFNDTVLYNAIAAVACKQDGGTFTASKHDETGRVVEGANCAPAAKR